MGSPLATRVCLYLCKRQLATEEESVRLRSLPYVPVGRRHRLYVHRNANLCLSCSDWNDIERKTAVEPTSGIWCCWLTWASMQALRIAMTVCYSNQREESPPTAGQYWNCLLDLLEVKACSTIFSSIHIAIGLTVSWLRVSFPFGLEQPSSFDMTVVSVLEYNLHFPYTSVASHVTAICSLSLGFTFTAALYSRDLLL